MRSTDIGVDVALLLKYFESSLCGFSIHSILQDLQVAGRHDGCDILFVALNKNSLVRISDAIQYISPLLACFGR